MVVTDGERGGWVLAEGEFRAYPPASPPAPVVDSNGAGDAFAAGFLAGHLAGEPVDRCLLYGAFAGAHACTVPATEVSPIDRETLRQRTDGGPDECHAGPVTRSAGEVKVAERQESVGRG